MTGPHPLSTTVDSIISTHDQRLMMGHFPTGVSVITSLDRFGKPHGMTCTSLTSVSLAPPTLLVCLNLESGTMQAVREQGRFGVNLLHHRSQRAARLFSGPTADRFSKVKWERSPKHGMPWLVDDAFAKASCTTRSILIAGDHAIAVAEMEEMDFREDTPLLYGMRCFTAWPSPST
ncbi:flavin reductase family protein (plasmid) [Nocardiopsis flavescens]|uniref:LooF n=1 Tax=Nocardiopsis flavescens TaxID=758803 RepID=A0A6M5K7V2_9ACTN|nr:LooF [Nocardiopsis flavescens]QKW32426.1 flavin reductase family protein [Nocardiopsis flavescens]